MGHVKVSSVAVGACRNCCLNRILHSKGQEVRALARMSWRQVSFEYFPMGFSMLLMGSVWSPPEIPQDIYDECSDFVIVQQVDLLD